MTQNIALSTTETAPAITAAPDARPEQWPAGKKHEHTLDSAKECLEATIKRNEDRHAHQGSTADPRGAAVREALQFGEILYRQVVGADDRKQFRQHLTELAAAHPRPEKPARAKVNVAPRPAAPVGPVYITDTKVAETLVTRANQVINGTATLGHFEIAASDILANKRRWDPVRNGAVLEEVRQQLTSLKRKLLLAEGTLALEDAHAQATAYADAFIARGGNSGRPAANRRDDRRPAVRGSAAPKPFFRNIGGGDVVRKDNAPKTVAKASEAEQLVKSVQARINRFDATAAGGVTLESLKAELAAAKALVTDEQLANAAKKKAERIKKAADRQRERNSNTFGEQKRTGADAAKAAPAPKKKGKR